MEYIHLALKRDDAIVLADLLESIGRHDFAMAISEATLYGGFCRWVQVDMGRRLSQGCNPSWTSTSVWGIACHPDINTGDYALVKRKADGAIQRVRVGEILVEASKTKWPVRAEIGTERIDMPLIRAVIETAMLNNP